MRVASAGLVLVVALAAAVQGAGASNAAASSDASPQARTLDLRFDAQLDVGDVRLSRPRASGRIRFAVEPRFKPVEGGRLHLFISHAPGLDPARSFLSILLNHGILRSLRLDEDNASVTEVVIPVPADRIRRANELTFEVEQATGGTADPWTVISARSYLLLAYEEAEWLGDLRDLPLPLLDPSGTRPPTLAVLQPSRLSLRTLEATVLVVANLARRVAPRPLALELVRTPDQGAGALLAIGTPLEQPRLRELQGSGLTIRDDRDGPALVVPPGRPLGPSSGVVGLTTIGGRSRSVLQVSGDSPEAVLRSAWALATASPTLQGHLAVVVEEPRPQARQTREWQGFIPPRTRFALSGLGEDRSDLREESPLRVSVRAPPDTRFLSYGHSLTLSIRPLPALLDQVGGALEVAWNEVPLRHAPVMELRRKPPVLLSLRIPAAMIRTDNVLSLSWKGSAGSGAPLLALDAEASELYLPRDHVARLPDLALLASSLFPFSLRPDFSDVVLVVPDPISEEVFVLACELAAFLGRMLPTELIGLRLRQPATLTAQERAAAHLILLRVAPEPDSFDAALPDWRSAPGRPAAVGAVLQEAVSPWGRGRYVLSLRAASASALLRAFRGLAQPEGLSGLAGDTAFLSPHGPICVALARPRVVRDANYLTHVEAWLRWNWIALPFVVALLSALLLLALRLALAYRKGEGFAYFSRASRGASRPS